jgi:GntR family transcriptional regulator of arabinose operon
MAKRSFTAEPHAPKYRQVLESLSKDILSGRYQPGQKLPSEAALVQQFGTSRITVGRALRDLAQRGLIDRVAGSGTYVRKMRHDGKGLLFGLLIPDLGRTEIFEPICRGIASAPRAGHHALLWGHSEAGQAGQERQAMELCDQFIERRVAGVFFAPLEAAGQTAQPVETNLAIVTRLEKARIPIVLLDRCLAPFPHRSRHDLVAIDNRRAGYLAAEHLLREPGRHLSMLAYSGGASTVDARISGFREAVLANGGSLESHPVRRLNEIMPDTVRPLLSHHRAGDSFVSANDRTAGELMRALLALGLRIPQDVRIVGIDDVEYASLLPVPLTTVRQPCREIGEAALDAMLDRVAWPDRFVRDILVDCRLVIRASCGAR